MITGGAGIREYELDDMHDLREREQIMHTAKESCSNFLFANHGRESDLFGAILEALDGSLQVKPAERSNASDLLQLLKPVINDQ